MTDAERRQLAKDALGALGMSDLETQALEPIVASILKVSEDHGRIAKALERIAALNEKLLQAANNASKLNGGG